MPLVCDGSVSNVTIADPMDAVIRFATLCEQLPKRMLRVHLNCFHGSLNETRSAHMMHALQRAGCAELSVSFVAGMKGLFWKDVLDPAKLLVSAAQFVWLVDADMATDKFELSRAIEEMDAANASLAQPRIAPFMRVHSRTTDWPLLRLRLGRKWPSNCLAAAMKFVEVQTPIFRRDAWSTVHRELLAMAPSGILAQTIWGISELWCPLLESHSSHRPACAVLNSSIPHLDTHLIERVNGMPNLTNIGERLWRARRVWRFDKGFGYWNTAFVNLSINKAEEFHRAEHRCLVRHEPGSL